jgi:site-specific DNA-adenine methylase
MIRSPLRYPGGKSRAVEKIAGLIPAFQEFREPFVGGGSVFIYLKQKFPDKKFWINDFYTDLAVFWQEIQIYSESVIRQIRSWRSDFQFDHRRFAETLRDCPHKWLLTYDDSPYVRELFSFANIADWNLMYGMRNVSESSSQKATELFISNFQPETENRKQIAFNFA